MSSPTATTVAVGEPVAAAPPPRRPRKQRAGQGVTRSGLVPLLLLSPAGLVILALTIVPIGYLVWMSFTDAGQRMLFTGEYDVVGLRQYRDVLTDPDFWHSFVRTVLFTGAMVGGSVVIGMGVAQLLSKLGRAMSAIIRVLASNGFRLPKELVLFFKNLLYLNGFAATLAPDSNLLDEIEPAFTYFMTRYPGELAAILSDL